MRVPSLAMTHGLRPAVHCSVNALVALTLAVGFGACRTASAPAPGGTLQPPMVIGQQLSVDGTAQNEKVGASVHTSTGSIHIDKLDAWPDALVGKRVRVTGTVIERFDLPVFVRRPGEPISSGIPVPEGTDLREASRRYLLGNATWSALPPDDR